MKNLSGIIIGIALLILLGCAGWDVPTPASSNEGRSTVVVSVYSPDYEPESPYIDSSSFGPRANSASSSATADTTDSLASITLDAAEQVKAGYYNVLVHSNDNQTALVESVYIDSTGHTTFSALFMPSGSLSGIIRDSSGPAPKGSFVYIPGTGFGTYTSDFGKFGFAGLPVGMYDITVKFPVFDSLGIDSGFVHNDLTYYSITQGSYENADSSGVVFDSTLVNKKLQVRSGEASYYYVEVNN